jgi:acyl carrier protein
MKELIQKVYKERHPEKKLIDINPTTNLLEYGYIDSLGIVEIIFYLEQMLGQRLAIEQYQPTDFYTLERMYSALSTIQFSSDTNMSS